MPIRPATNQALYPMNHLVLDEVDTNKWRLIRLFLYWLLLMLVLLFHQMVFHIIWQVLVQFDAMVGGLYAYCHRCLQVI